MRPHHGADPGGWLHHAARGVVAGTAFGIVVWLVSYVGWIAALRIMPPPTRDDLDRVVPVHAAHWIYGATLGAVEERLRSRRALRA